MSENILDSVDIEYIDPKEAKFAITGNHMMTLDWKGKHYPSVQLHRSFPYSNPTQYISVRDDDDSDKDKVREIGNDKKIEIGVIRDLMEFDQVTIQMIEKFLALRYFAPSIDKIIEIREEFGYRYWTVGTDMGECKFTTTLNRNAIVHIGSADIVMIYDVDGNRFKVEGFSKCDPKIRKRIEMFM